MFEGTPVKVLTDADFEYSPKLALKDHKHNYCIIFYSPSCPHCHNKRDRIIEDAETALSEQGSNNVFMGSVNINENPKVAQALNIEFIPQFYLSVVCETGPRLEHFEDHPYK